jgi:hypothetical protein
LMNEKGVEIYYTISNALRCRILLKRRRERFVYVAKISRVRERSRVGKIA